MSDLARLARAVVVLRTAGYGRRFFCLRDAFGKIPFICGCARHGQLCGVKRMKDDIFLALYFAFQSFGNYKSILVRIGVCVVNIAIHPL